MTPDLSKPGRAFLIGIGGIGMSAIARFLKAKGWSVAGYDRTPSPLTEQLEAEGIAVSTLPDVEAIPAGWRADLSAILTLYTPAIPASLPILQLLQRTNTLFKRSEILGWISQSLPCFAIAGTHGKTTTSTLLAHLLNDRCNAFLGGISAATGSNLYLSERAQCMVVEADEFDRSFLHLHPTHAVITSLDPDHLDIYGTTESFVEGFQTFSMQVEDSLLMHHSLIGRLSPGVAVTSYGVDTGDLCAQNVLREGPSTRFSLKLPSGDTIDDLVFPMPGLHNLENAVAASGLALRAGLPHDLLRQRLEDFQGVHRRFQYHILQEERAYIDDYAHHPEELKKTIEAARTAHPGKSITGIFQPHLFTRTRDNLDAFARELSALDAVILLPIYAARESPIPGVDSQSLFDKISAPLKELTSAHLIFDCLKEMPCEVVLTLGAGDIDRLVKPLTLWLLDNLKA